MTKHQTLNLPKRVALAGFGVVGRGVYEKLLADAERFEVVGVLCRDPERHVAEGGPEDLLTADADALPAHDIFVEAIGGVVIAESLVIAAIECGAHVASANKTLFARRYDVLKEAAHAAGVRFRYSAAVGGGVPMLETIDECAIRGKITQLEAVLNGTTNFVLDRIGSGATPADAVFEAQEAGFAEADPSADIDGRDAAEKLSLMARHAFGVGVDPDEIPTDRLYDFDAEDILEAQKKGTPYKQIGKAQMTSDGVTFEVRLVRTPSSDPLGRPKLEENCLVITNATGGKTVIDGKGAGREPTAESVYNDLLVLASYESLRV